MSSLDAFARTKLAHLDGLALRRTLAETDRSAFPVVERDGARLLSFCCNDYFGLSHHPAVIAAAVEATRRHGAGAGASRLVTGNHPGYAALEARLATMKGTEAACVFGSGYLANLGVLGALAGPSDLILIDELAHACLNAGAKLSGAMVVRFRHNDADHVGALLDHHRGAHRHALIVTETVFSMDGDQAPIGALAALASAHDAWLATDDAHGLGLGLDHAAHLRLGTLSKAIGSYGGYLCASAPVVALVETRARSFVYATALPPGPVAAAHAALGIVVAEPGLAQEPLRKARRFTHRLGMREAESPIVPLILGGADDALAASATLAGAGFLVTAIRPPTVPPGTARLRFTFSAVHADEDIDRLAAVVAARILSKAMPCPASS